MGYFVGRLELTPIGKRRWKLLNCFSFHADDSMWAILVREGFDTDFGSIPRALWWLYPPYGDTWGKAAIIHDYLYATQQLYRQPFGRKWADQIFLEGMIALGANWFRRTIMYQSVRLCAGGAWKKHAKRIATEEVGRTVGDMLQHNREVV